MDTRETQCTDAMGCTARCHYAGAMFAGGKYEITRYWLGEFRTEIYYPDHRLHMVREGAIGGVFGSCQIA